MEGYLRKIWDCAARLESTSLRTSAWTGVPSCVNCFTISSPTPLLPPATNTGDLPRYFEAIIVIDLDDTLLIAMQRVITAATKRVMLIGLRCQIF